MENVGNRKMNKPPENSSASDSLKPRNFLASLMEYYEEEEKEKTYLKELADKFSPKEPKNYPSVRSIVLDVHFRLEAIINYSLVYSLLAYNKKTLMFNVNDFNKISGEVSNIDYAKIMKIVENLKIYTPTSVKILWKANDLRVAFAHQHPKDSPKYEYFGESIFKRKTIERLIADLKVVISEHVTFISEGGD